MWSSHAHAGQIADLFRHYNRRLSQQQALNFEHIVKDAGKSFGVSPNLIAAIIVVESGARPNVISKGGDYGLMQVRWKVHRKEFPWAKDILEPKTNILIGTAIYARYFAREKTVYGALVRYSGGGKKTARKVIKIMKGEK